MIPLYVAGFDFGNSDTCMCLIDHQGINHVKVLPSATGFASLRDLATIRSGSSGHTYENDAAALVPNERVIEYQGSEYFVGDLAIDQLRSANTGRKDAKRYASLRALLLLLTVSASLIDSPEYELHVVTGLPIETYSKENRKGVKGALEGDHVFALNGRRHRAVIRISRVIMEGAGALIVYGNSQSPLQGVIDVGGRTTDLFVARGQEPLIDECVGKDIGVETVGDRLSVKVENQFGRSMHAPEVRTCLRAYLGQGVYQPINAKGQEVSPHVLQDLTEKTVREVANEVLGFIAQSWNSSEKGDVASDIAPVALVGGGAYYFHGVIKSRVPHAIMPMKPERANAEGYAALANVLHAQDRMTA